MNTFSIRYRLKLWQKVFACLQSFKVINEDDDNKIQLNINEFLMIFFLHLCKTTNTIFKLLNVKTEENLWKWQENAHHKTESYFSLLSERKRISELTTNKIQFASMLKLLKQMHNNNSNSSKPPHLCDNSYLFNHFKHSNNN